MEKQMSDESFFTGARARSSIVGPPLSKAEITTVFAGAFPGNEDLVEFYWRQNRGCRTPQAGFIYCGTLNIEFRAIN
jgi:hypothetical protein